MDLYGKKITNREILMKGTVKAPKAAAGLMTELNRYSSRK
jgi:lipid-binding SYLF domain-containing protein